MYSPTLASRLGPALELLRARGVCTDFAFLQIPGSAAPWIDTGLALARGSGATILAEGELVTSAEVGLVAGARFHLWRRLVPGGEVAKATRDTASFVAERDGRLELGILHGEWLTRSGEPAAPAEAWAAVEGALDVTVVAWAEGVSPEDGLAQVAGCVHDPLVDAERQRLALRTPRPPGWSYLWLLGESETFRVARDDSRDVIACHTRDDAAILRYEVDLPTREDTVISWRWCVDELPSSKPEDALLQHDYLSIAVEWDCGRDITWMWSESLPVGRVFTCPIPQWAPRETHVVARSGREGLGRWWTEEQPLHSAYREILGSEPGRIVAVWLIAVSLFQHGEGRARFDAIELRSGGERVAIHGG